MSVIGGFLPAVGTSRSCDSTPLGSSNVPGVNAVPFELTGVVSRVGTADPRRE